MLTHCEQPLIIKKRHVLIVDNHIWEIDEFLGHKTGLIVAEIELGSLNENLVLPEWIGEEVTGNKLYSNANM